MTAISAQTHNRCTADPSNGSPVAAPRLRQAARTLPRKQIASLRARERQDATQAIEDMGRHPRTATRRLRSAIRAMNGRLGRLVMGGRSAPKGDVIPSKTDH